MLPTSSVAVCAAIRAARLPQLFCDRARKIKNQFPKPFDIGWLEAAAVPLAEIIFQQIDLRIDREPELLGRLGVPAMLGIGWHLFAAN
jgi:hypothetical protein